jgi:hypothetical protein
MWVVDPSRHGTYWPVQAFDPFNLPLGMTITEAQARCGCCVGGEANCEHMLFITQNILGAIVVLTNEEHP